MYSVCFWVTVLGNDGMIIYYYTEMHLGEERKNIQTASLFNAERLLYTHSYEQVALDKLIC